MAKIKTYSVTKPVADENGNVYKIFVYGEVTEEKNLDGIEVRRVRYRRNTEDVVAGSEGDSIIYPLWDNCSPTKTFNFGYAICAPEDEFNEEIGIEVARKRFSENPIRTQDCRFLKKGMVEAILNQSAEYIATHEFKDFLKKKTIRERVFKDLKDGELIEMHDSYNNRIVGAISLSDNNNVHFYWYANLGAKYVEFKPSKYPFPIRYWDFIERISDTDRENLNTLLKHKYKNKWDEENKRFIKA